MTAIEWTDVSWNPVRGCSRVSRGCEHCYAEVMAGRIVAMSRGRGVPDGEGPYDRLVKRVGGEARWTGKVVLDPEKLAEPLRWRKPRRVFVNSMSDLFHESLTDDEIAAVFGVMAACPRHTFQVLTKRPERAARWFEWVERVGRMTHFIAGASAEFRISGMPGAAVMNLGGLSFPGALRIPERWPLPNVWLLTSCEDQGTADERIPWLLRCPAAVRGVSLEPLLSPIDLEPYVSNPDGSSALGWVIVGGESGHSARPMDIRWAESIVEQCAAAGVPCFVKQLGSRPVRYEGSIATVAKFNPPDSMVLRLRHPRGGDPSEWPPGYRVREYPA